MQLYLLSIAKAVLKLKSICFSKCGVTPSPYRSQNIVHKITIRLHEFRLLQRLRGLCVLGILSIVKYTVYNVLVNVVLL